MDSKEAKKLAVGKYLRECWEKRPERELTQTQLGEALDMSQGNVGHYLRGSQLPTPGVFTAFVNQLGISLRDVPKPILEAVMGYTSPELLDFIDLSDQINEGRRKETLKLMEEVYESALDEAGSYTFVPKSSISAGLGSGEFEFASEQIVDHMAFKTSWLERRGLTKSNLALIECSGDSMTPTLSDGDLVLIDLTDNIPSEGLYAIAWNHNVRIKRLEVRSNGDVKVSSDNPRYEPETIPSDRLDDDLRTLGRAVWVGRELS